MWCSKEMILLAQSIVLCFVFSQHSAHGKTSIVIRNAQPIEAIYAKSYGHGAPISAYRVDEGNGRTVRDVWKLRARRENSVQNYASKYKTWSPNKGKLRFREPPFKSSNMFVKRRRPFAPFPPKFAENEFFYSRRPGRPKKQRGNGIQRPNPLNDVSEEYESDDFVPEETKRNEAQYEYREGLRRPLKKRRNPPERKKKPKKPVPYPKPLYDDDDRRIVFDEDRHIFRSKPKRQPSISYSTFIQHSPGESQDADYDYEEVEVRPTVNVKKKRRIKKKTNKHRDEEDGDEYRTDGYRYIPSYSSDDEYESSSRNKIKVKKYKPEPQPVYGDGHISNQYLPTNSFRSQIQDDYPPQSSQKLQTYNAAPYPQIQSITNPSQTFKSSYETSIYPTYAQPSNVHYNRITQPSQDVYGYNSQKSGNYASSSFISSPVNPYESLSSSSSTYHGYRNYQEPQQTQQSSVYYSPSVSFHKDVSTSYKTSPAYDSTDTFKDFNSNASNQKKYATYSSKYSESDSIIPSVQIPERPEQENDFLQKHQNLYNNGISGIPVQGDGYMNKDSKKDYDIGYGEFQFDENPA